MTGIVLSASVRQNLLSLQSTASLLATTQSDLSTGNKVNSALDNPTSFFTASALNNRASDISNLLDGIGNGVQVLQAANTGITSLQSLVASAQSVANQVLQTPIGYSSKSSVSSAAIAGATANNLLGGVATNASLTATTALGSINLTAGAATNDVATGSVALAATTTAATSGSLVAGAGYTGNEFVGGGGSNDSITIKGTTISFDGTTDGTTAIADTTTHKYTEAEAVSKINHDLTAASSTVTASVGTGANAGKIVLTDAATGTTSNFSVSTAGAVSGKTGGLGATATATGGAGPTGGIDASGGAKSFTISLDGGVPTTVTLSATGGANSDGHYSANDIKTAINSALTTAGVTTLAATVDSSNHLVLTSTSNTKGAADTIALTDVASSGVTAALGITASTHGTATADRTFQVNSQIVTLAGGASYTAAQITAAINTQVGATAHVAASLDTTGHLVLASTGTAGSTDTLTVNNFSAGTDPTELGLPAGTSATATGLASTGGISGQTLQITATKPGDTATNITFGTSQGQISTLNDLNTALASNDLQATIDSTGVLTITTSNNAASSTVGTVSGTIAGLVNGVGQAFNGKTAAGPVADPNAQATRTGLISQYNNILKQIDTTAQDSSFNGVNLLEGDTLNLTFDETGKSTLAITGVTFNTAGLGLSTLTNGTDFLDSNSANKVLSSLTQVSTTLRSEASNLGSNLSIVQIRQDFSKNLINVLQTGASNLTLADTNEEAANSQALSTRQSIAVSALSLANQSQQSVLQLLR